MKRMGGFTLIELLIVIMIIAVLAGAMIPVFRTTRLQAQQAKVGADLDSIKTAAMMYHQDTGTWPPIGIDGNGLVGNSGAPNWNGPYVDEWRTDPWATAYNIYAGPGVTRYIQSMGSDKAVGGTGGATDINLLMTANASF